MKKQKKIANKLFTAFMVVALLGAFAAVLQASQGILNGQRYSKAMDDYGFSQGYVSRAMMALTDTRTTIRLAIEKLMGKSVFKGVSPVDAFCGLPDTRL